MDHILPAGSVFQAGTLSGNPLATAAGIATLETLRDTNPYPALDKLTERLASGMERVANAAGIPHNVARVGSMMTFFFNPMPVTDWEVAALCDVKRYAEYFHGLLDRGFYMPCSQYEALFVSTVHTDTEIDATIDAVAEVLSIIA
jgi:glutamate-1-semialdehyde 2,1-aminomutase